MARPLNLLIAAATYGFSAWLSADKTGLFWYENLFWAQGAILIGAMAGGYWINDVFDRQIDLVNKPDKVIVGKYLSRKKTLTVYFVFTFFLAAGAAFLPLKYQLLDYGALAALYLYARYFKRYAVIGNLVVAALTAMVVLSGALLFHIKFAHVWGMIFSFLINFQREVVKDVEDLEGDLRHGLRTLPIQIGLRQTRRALFGGYATLLAATAAPLPVYYFAEGAFPLTYAYAAFFLSQSPVFFCGQYLRAARRPKDYRRQSVLLKLVMAGGLVTLAWL